MSPTLTYIKGNITSCVECPILQNNDYYATCHVVKNNVICQCKYPFVFNDDQTKCVHFYHDDIPIYLLNYLILIPLHFYLLVSTLRLYIHKVKKLCERKNPTNKYEKVTMLINGNTAISSMLLCFMYLLCKGIRESIFVWIKPSMYISLRAAFYFLCGAGTLLFYNLSIMTTKHNNNMRLKKCLRNFSLCFCCLGVILLSVGAYIKTWPSIVTDIFNQYMSALYALLLVVGIIYFGKKITSRLSAFNSSQSDDDTNKNNRTTSSSRSTGARERKKIQILLVMNFYLKMLVVYLGIMVFCVVFENRKMYNNTWHPYTKAKQLVFTILWRISDFIVVISVLRIFEGTTSSRFFPWLHICKKDLESLDSEGNVKKISSYGMSSYNAEDYLVDGKLPNETINPVALAELSILDVKTEERV